MARIPLVRVPALAAAAAKSVGEGTFDIEKSQYKLMAFFRILSRNYPRSFYSLRVAHLRKNLEILKRWKLTVPNVA